jgi:hypothetical protein
LEPGLANALKSGIFGIVRYLYKLDQGEKEEKQKEKKKKSIFLFSFFFFFGYLLQILLLPLRRIRRT